MLVGGQIQLCTLHLNYIEDFPGATKLQFSHFWETKSRRILFFGINITFGRNVNENLQNTTPSKLPDPICDTGFLYLNPNAQTKAITRTLH